MVDSCSPGVDLIEVGIRFLYVNTDVNFSRTRLHIDFEPVGRLRSLLDI